MATALFEYHCWESDESVDAELWHHTPRQPVTVVHQLGSDEVDEEIGRMYHVCFQDGFEGNVFEDELIPIAPVLKLA